MFLLYRETLTAQNLQQSIGARADYDDIKRELALLKNIEFGTDDGADEHQERPLEASS